MTSQLGTLKILMVDADQVFVESFVPKLHKVGVFTSTVEVCTTGFSMLERVFCQPYDIVFMEVNLPDISGLEILGRVARTSLPLPIVMMTANTNARLAVEAMKRGVLDFIMKEDLLNMDLGGLLSRLQEAFRLRRENAELQQISRMKDDFLATISHELRTPLTSVLGLSEVLLTGRMGPLQTEQTNCIKKILSQSQHLVRIINQLLDLRALAQDGMRSNMRPASLKSIVEKQVSALQNLFEKKGVTLELVSSPHPLVILAEEESITKVVEHLVSNALKFTSKGGHVKVESRFLESGQVQVAVQDSGRGIPAEALPHLFQKFYHVDQSLTRPYGGMGLGLAFCKEVLQLHGGRVWIESKGVGQGTQVSFILPASDQKLDVPQPGELRSSGSLPVTEKKNVLWVDDNPNLLELVEYAFAGSSMSINLQTALSGASALSQVKTLKPDLLVLDVMMTDMDGLEVLDHLRSDPETEKLPVLIVSGYKEAAKTAMEHGANDYCLKPFRIQEIFKKVETLLQK